MYHTRIKRPDSILFDLSCLYQALLRDNWGLQNSKLVSEKAQSKSCSKSIASYFYLTILGHNVPMTGSTFPPIFHYVLLCDRQQLRGSPTKVSHTEEYMKQRCITEFFHARRNGTHNIHRCLLNVYRDQGSSF